jgi:ATP-binding cassette subfamily C protein CydC
MAVSAYLISKAALTTQVSTLLLAITGVRFFAICRAGGRYLERIVSHTATFKILTRLRVWFYESIEPMAPAGLMAYRSGDLLTRVVADVETLENFYVRVVVPPLVAAAVTALATLVLGRFDPILGAALLVFLLLAGVVLPLFTARLSRAPVGELIAARADLNAALVDHVQGSAEIVAFGQQEAFEARIVALGEALNRAQERTALVRGMSGALGTLLASLAGLSVLWLAIPLVTSGQIDGVYLALLPLTAIASFEAVQPLSLALQYWEESKAAAARLFELIDSPGSVVEPQKPAPAPTHFDLEMRDLRFSYGPGDPPVLDGLTFTVPQGGHVALVGPSGAGKSSVANLLARFWEPGSGAITLGGRDLRSYASDDVRRVIGVVPQQTHLFNTTIRDNLLLAKSDATDGEIEAACREAQIHDFVAGLPHGYDTLVGENGVRLSGGERQRLAIARVLLKNAPVLILDEPVSQLDGVTRERVWEALQRFMEGRTSVMIAHEATEAPAGVQTVEL